MSAIHPMHDGTKQVRTIHIHGQEHDYAQDALVELNFSGDFAISIGGRCFTVDTDEYERIQAEGFQPTTFFYNDAIGRIMSVPGKH